MRFDIITILPELFKSAFSGGIIKKALEKGTIEIHIHNLREFTVDKHQQVDDRPYGGGEGMVFKPEPVFAAVEKVKQSEETAVYLLSPQGKKFDSQFAEELAHHPQLILICGRYEGVDERMIQHLVTGEISIGDYILTGGEPAAVVVVDAVSRFIPQVVGKPESVRHDSFVEGLLSFPQYTRPRDFKGMKVPRVLFSGNHDKIRLWRRKKSLEKTLSVRPDLLKDKKLSPADKKILEEIKKGKDNESG
ncbi:MAG: tRNA (guanosine(37)-N1)-methyltransferase TrmD [Candidatus Aminicenantes bacterium]|nr:tRNA (guanosine(37)-N1)-methyltransferase TrmD [Candidatus Aminicenantes bacterium]